MRISSTTRQQKYFLSSGEYSLNAMAAPCFALDQNGYQSLFTDLLREIVANDNSAAKRLSAIAGCSIATAKNWLSYKATPHGLHLARLRAAIPKVDAEMRRIEGLYAEFDPEAERRLNELLNHLMRRGAL